MIRSGYRHCSSIICVIMAFLAILPTLGDAFSLFSTPTCVRARTAIRDARLMYASPRPMDESPLSTEMVAGMIERSFVQACLQLADGYVDVLKLFIAATKAGYELGMNHNELVDLVNSNQQNSAGRLLMAEENSLRTTWIHAIYFTLAHVNWRNITHSQLSLNSSDNAKYLTVLDEMVDLKVKGSPLQVDNIVQMHPALLSDSSTLADKAVVSHTLRVIWLTMDVMEEEELAKPRRRGDPRPPIPGAFQDSGSFE